MKSAISSTEGHSQYTLGFDVAFAGLDLPLVNRPDIMDFVAISDIKEDEEITINYNGDPNDKTPVRFPLAE